MPAFIWQSFTKPLDMMAGEQYPIFTKITLDRLSSCGLLNSFLTQYLDILSNADPNMERPISLRNWPPMPVIKDWFEALGTHLSQSRRNTRPTMACMAELAINGLQERL